MDNQEIEQKVIRVIESCKTVDHIDAATKYVLLFDHEGEFYNFGKN